VLAGSLVSGAAITATLLGEATPASAQPAVTLYVAPSGSGDCTSQVNACGSIQTAINTATGGSYSGDDVTIDVADGTYTENDTIDASSLDSLTIQGAGQGSTFVDGSQADPVFIVQSGTVAMSDLTIENGQATGDGNGGGIDSCDGSSGCQLTVSNSTFTNNDAPGNGGREGLGGAIDNGDNGGQGTLTVTDSTFTDNTAYSQGGAIDSCLGGSGCTVTVTGSTFTGNSAFYGGSAIYNAGSGYNNNDNAGGQGTLSVTDSTFTDNTGADGGGVIENAEGAGNGSGPSDGTVTVTDSTFSDNTASHGGAIDSGDQGGTGTVTVTDSTFSGNLATNDGGAIDNGDNSDNNGDVGGSVTVSDSTFSDNTASSNGGASDGGAIDNDGIGTTTVADSTFAGNTAGHDGGAIDNADVGGSGTVTITSSTLWGNWAGSAGGSIDNPGAGDAVLAATILAAAPTGGECSGTVTDGGYNIDDDGSCGFTATGSVSDSATLDATLGALKQNQGPTQTMLSDSDSPTVGAIPNNTTLGADLVCPTTDQQGVASAPGGSCNIGATQTEFTAPTISAVTFSGTPAAPTVTVWGSGFGTEADLGTPVPAYGGGTGSDFGTQFFLLAGFGAGEGAGPYGDFVGLDVSSYSDDQITFTFGSQYANYGPLSQGEPFSVTLLGTTFNGTASYPSHSSAGTPPYAYVANYGDGTVTPISTATGTADTPINVGTHPEAIAVSPDGTTAYVANQGSGTVTPIATATNTGGTAITVGASPEAIAITPNGQTAYVANYGDGTVTPITTATNTPGTPISVGTGPSAIAISPDGQNAYVTVSGSNEVVPIATATDTPGTPIPVGNNPVAIAITPDGQTAYVANGLDGTVTPIDLASQTAEPAIVVAEAELTAIAITPDGTTAYVTDNGNTVTSIDLATQTVGTTITVGNDPHGIAFSPDGQTAYAANYDDNTVTPVTTSTGATGNPINVGNGPTAVAFVPDQGPTAALAASTTGSTTSFDASDSVPGTSPIVSYSWNFGDGNTATTSSPTTTHTYGAGVCAGTMSSPACTATVTETDAAGASTTQVTTGQTVSLNGSGAAVASASVEIVTTDCTSDNTCEAAVAAPATSTSAAQSVTVSVPAAGSASGTLTVSSGPGQINCTAKGFKVVSDVTSYSSTFTPSTNVQVSDVISGVASTKKIKICFEGASPPPKFLKKCARTPVAPCATLVESGGNVDATILVPGNDPKFHIDGVETLTESPTSYSTKGTIGKTITIKGTDLLGATGQSKPSVAFTSLGGSTIAGPVTTATATKVTVEVPNGAATGTITVAWTGETLTSDGPITIAS
jgi:YVTN family beta-propeller protein